MRFLISIIIAAFFFTSCTSAEEGPLTDYPNSHLLLSADELNSMLDDPELFLIDARGSHAYFTLRLMSYDSVRPYEGSWSEYGNRTDAVIQ